jgi:hypothetical protein
MSSTSGSAALWTILAVVAGSAVITAIAWYLRPETKTLVAWSIASAFGIAMVSFLVLKDRGASQRYQHLIDHGLQGTAEVLALSPTNVLINRRPQARMRLRVRLQGRPDYELERLDVLPMSGIGAGPGQTVKVYVNPDDPQDLMIDWSRSVRSQGAPADAGGRLQTLEDLRARGLIDEAEYQRKRQEILDAL